MGRPKVVVAATTALLDDRERQLMRCRRRGERASVLVARLSPDRPIRPERLLASLRVTDSATVICERSGYELQAVLEDGTLIREGIERRLRELVGDADACFGWARFPDEGLTLDLLLERARLAVTGEGA